MKSLPAETDFVVIGAGVAGLRAAIELADAGRVLVLAKQEVTNSRAQSATGESTAALSDEEGVMLHLLDTLVAGDGLCLQQAVKTLVDDGSERIEEVIAWGDQLDRKGTKLIFETEASYTHSHVLRAPGGSTGHEILRVLQAKVQAHKQISLLEFEFCTGLLTEDARVSGVSLISEKGLSEDVPCFGGLAGHRRVGSDLSQHHQQKKAVSQNGARQ
jgi:L-aspartate oxidase